MADDRDYADEPNYVFSQRHSPFSKGHRAWVSLGVALQTRGTSQHQQLTEDHGEPEADRFSSTIPVLDRLLSGGFYGTTVLGGTPGLRKSSLAMAIAIEAACRNWQVVYHNAELAADEFEQRGEAYLAAHPETVDCRELFHIFHAPRGVTPETMVTDICSVVTDCDSPVLVVIDSINTLAELSGMPYLHALQEFSLWAMMARRISRGAVSFLIVAELNQRGGIKGEKLGFWADVNLQMKRGRSTDAHGPVELTLRKSRSTGGEGPLGTFVWDPRCFRFVKPAEIYAPPLRVVGGSSINEPEEGDLF